MHRIHPVGKLNADVRYADIYEWLKCLGLTPCAGWMNKNETVRQLTTKVVRLYVNNIKFFLWI